ncbi:MAG: PilZ domain-containing protein [Lachnospiraceae bacterium]|nr:PilZ domain-containing protein [Lachnospiraceae bacterium]
MSNANELFEVGNKIVLKLIRKHDTIGISEDEDASYTGVFMEFISQHHIRLKFSGAGTEASSLDVGDECILLLFTGKGSYQCKAEVSGYSRDDGYIYLKMKLLSNPEKKQRRLHFRLDCIIPLKYAVINEEEREFFLKLSELSDDSEKERQLKDKEENGLSFIDATILDISGGGIKANSVCAHEKNTYLFLKPEFPPDIKLKIPWLIGKIVSSRPVNNKTGIFDNRIAFTDISASERETLICYIFKLERDKRLGETEISA